MLIVHYDGQSEEQEVYVRYIFLMLTSANNPCQGTLNCLVQVLAQIAKWVEQIAE